MDGFTKSVCALYASLAICKQSSIKQKFVANMGDERVETLVYRICWDRLELDKLRSTIVDTLTDDVLSDNEVDEETQGAWGNAEQITILRNIYLALVDADVDVARVIDIDQRTDRAERGPHYFNLVMIMYSAWSQRWREANGYARAPAIPVFCIERSFES
jgi:hypothetical protein